MKYVFLALVVFGAYSGYKFLPVLSTKSAIAHAVAVAVPDVTDEMSEAVAKKKIIRAASVASIDLDAERIQVTWERRSGERIFHVEIEHPVTVSYLGSERTIDSHVQVTEVVEVDEAAEARLAATRQRNQRRRDRIRAANAKLKSAIEDCERDTGGPCGVRGGGYSRMAPEEVEIIRDW